MTLLERWNRGWMEGPTAKGEIRRCIAIAQAVEEWSKLPRLADRDFAALLLERADELMNKDKP